MHITNPNGCYIVLCSNEERLLEDIGFPWNPREDACSIRYHELCNYVEQHGRTPKSTEDISLYNWLAKQKKLYKIGQLEKDKEVLLLNLHIELVVQTSEEVWQKRL